MSGRRLFTDEQLDELGALREEGKSLGWLARHARLKWGIEVHTNAISWQMLRIGADLPPEKRQTVRIGPMVMQRGNHIVRRYTPEEDALLLKLEAEGLSPTAIGERMGRRWNSIKGRLMTLARHEARQEEAA